MYKIKDFPDYFVSNLEPQNLQYLECLDNERLSWIEQKNFVKYKDCLMDLTNLMQEYKSHFVSTELLDIKEDVISVYANNYSKDKKIVQQDFEREILQIAKRLIPWKKGPFNLFDKVIDAEWRSDLKWQRFKDAIIDIEDKNVLDIGCNNGYFMFLLSQFQPRFVLGIDPVISCFSQFQFINNFYQLQKNKALSYPKKSNLCFKLWGVEHVEYLANCFDLILYMGIIYHHKSPIDQLEKIRDALKPGGQVIYETIGIPGDSSTALFPEGRYAKMRNVWFIPTLSCSINWLKKAKFKDIEVLDDSLLTESEQRVTSWCREGAQSLKHFLDPKDSSKTIEGYLAPRRFCISARK